MRGWRSWLMGMALTLMLVSGVRAQADTDPSVAIQVARHGMNGAVIPVLSTVDANGTVLPAPAEAGEYLIISGASLPPNLPVLAYLVTPTRTFPLSPYQPSAQNVMTDTAGTMQVTYALPPADSVTERNAQITLIVAASDDDESVAVSTSVVFALPSPV